MTDEQKNTETAEQVPSVRISEDFEYTAAPVHQNRPN